MPSNKFWLPQCVVTQIWLKFAAIVVFAALALSATACGPIPTTAPSTTPTAMPTASRTATPPRVASPTAPPTPSVVRPAPTRVLKIGFAGFPDVLDPQKASSDLETEILRLVYQGLVSVDEKGNLQPAAADRWDLSKDGTQMTFHIRDGLQRANGTALTAADYEFALKRALDPRITDKPNTFLLHDIKGAQELDALDPAAVKPEDVEKALSGLGIKATSADTLSITFKKPVGYWTFVASTWLTFPSEKKQVDLDPDGWWSRSDGHNGNGPFAIRTIVQGKQIVLVPNRTFWRGRPKLDRIELLFYPSSSTVLQAYQKGEIDLDASVTPDALPTLSSDPLLSNELLRYPAAVTYAIGFNIARKPFDDRNVRLAFSQALDREGWVRQVLNGVGKPFTRWIPPGVLGAQAKPGVPDYDPKAAVSTLVNNGYAAKESTADSPKVDCAKLGDIKLTYAASPLNQTRYQFLESDFTRVFSCPIKSEPVQATDWSLFKDPKTRPLIFFQGYLQDYAHPQDWLSLYWTCNSPFAERSGYCNKNLDALLAKADQEPDLSQAVRTYQDAEDLLMKDVPAAFSSYSENTFLVKRYVIGPKDHVGSGDAAWPGEWGPVWDYDIDVEHVPADSVR